MPKTSISRSKTIGFRVDETEQEKITACASQRGMRVAEYARFMTLQSIDMTPEGMMVFSTVLELMQLIEAWLDDKAITPELKLELQEKVRLRLPAEIAGRSAALREEI